ncbi:hypothetical protein B0H34DRAFT_799064 [Crassisporium funariophilum]|nr:hypothetical protein B0H34DRAFT_799064 [Crassisporium funariophilum]
MDPLPDDLITPGPVFYYPMIPDMIFSIFQTYAPVTSNHHFGIKILAPPKKAGKEAIDVNKYNKFKALAEKIIHTETPKILVIFSLEDIKQNHKKGAKEESDASAANSDASQDIDEPKVGGIEKEIARC